MKTIYRIDGKDFETQSKAVDYVAATYFPGAENIGTEKEPDRDGFNISVFDEDSDAEPVTVFIVES